jgi:ADP-ribose pyrophosphatase YjhB (NUDIX family)
MDIFALLDEVQTIARNGLHYAQDLYDRERYKRLLSLATNSYSELSDLPEDAIRTRFAQELGHITPKVGSDAAIFNDKGEILLMDRVDGSGWCLPCGWVEPNERPIDSAIREVREETGLEVEYRQFVGVFTRMPDAVNGPHTMIAVVHLCDVVGGELTLSHEGVGLRYWAIDDVPRWHTTHEKYARAAYTMWKSESLLPAISN